VFKTLTIAAVLLWPQPGIAQTKTDIASALVFFDQMAAASRAQDGLAFMITHTPDAVFLPNQRGKSAAEMRVMLMELYRTSPQRSETLDAQVYKTRATFGAVERRAWAAVPFKTVTRTGDVTKETCIIALIFHDETSWFFGVRGPGGLHPALAAAYPDLAGVPLTQKANCVDAGS
jgi:hypothetical protein